jgi:hypothetical protein
MMSTGLVPVSFALTGPIAESFGAAETMVASAVLGGVIFAALLFVPGVRDPEKDEWVRATEEAARAAGLAP